MPHVRGFVSDNNAGAHPAMVEAIAHANLGHVPAYGADRYTQSATQKFKEHFGPECDVYFVFNGTGANTLALRTLTQSYNAILCADTAHIYEDECGAPENFTGCKLMPIATTDGKLRVENLLPYLKLLGSEHKVQPKVISITQTTEYGTLYQPDEIRALAHFAHDNNMYLHMDGARISNAAAALNLRFREFTNDVGVDALSFGGTKIGMLFGEAVCFFNSDLGKNFKFMRKHGLQLNSKMRFVAAQFEALLSNDLWLKNARHANAMAKLLANELKSIEGVRITQPVEANGVFAIMKPEHLAALRQTWAFHTWDDTKNEVRWMTSFDTTADDVANFVADIRGVVRG